MTKESESDWDWEVYYKQRLLERTAAASPEAREHIGLLIAAALADTRAEVERRWPSRGLRYVFKPTYFQVQPLNITEHFLCHHLLYERR